MARAEKIIKKWKKGQIKGDEKFSDVWKVIKHILKFGEEDKDIWNFDGQHLRIHHPKLKGWVNSKGDSLTIPTNSKKTVRGDYVKNRIVPLAEYLEELD